MSSRSHRSLWRKSPKDARGSRRSSLVDDSDVSRRVEDPARTLRRIALEDHLLGTRPNPRDDVSHRVTLELGGKREASRGQPHRDLRVALPARQAAVGLNRELRELTTIAYLTHPPT